VLAPGHVQVRVISWDDEQERGVGLLLLDEDSILARQVRRVGQMLPPRGGGAEPRIMLYNAENK
jgi:hypothetical protein